MGLFEEAFRNFWLSELHKVKGTPKEGVAKWLTNEDYVVNAPCTLSEFTVYAVDSKELIRCFACDSARMASASIETVLGIDETTRFPKSTGWIVIRIYYAAFFAAHAILRMMGGGCYQLETSHINSCVRVAAASGHPFPNPFPRGAYILTFDSNSSILSCRPCSSQGGGSHVVLWRAFISKLRALADFLLQKSSVYNDVSLKLFELEELLTQDGKNNGEWLSHVRNRINYQHDFGVWHPYVKSSTEASELIKIISDWRNSPDIIQLPQDKNEIATHVALCTFIVAMCHSIAKDMEAHSLTPKSFHAYTSLALARLAEI